MGMLVWAYITGLHVVSSSYAIVSLGIYGVVLWLHILMQSVFAFVELRRMKGLTQPCSYTKTVGFTISAFQEEPTYLRECLNSIRALQYPPQLLRIIMVVDGNSQDDLYMLEMFQEVFADQEPACYVWSNNYHSWDPAAAGTGVGEAGEDPQRKEVETLISSRRCVCIMQRWGGKREDLPVNQEDMDLKPLQWTLGGAVRAGLTFLFALALMGMLVWAYITGLHVVSSLYGIVSLGIYGVVLWLHVLMQSVFAFVELRRMKGLTQPCSYTKTVGFTISAFQEEPTYLRECLNSIRALQYPPQLLRIIMVVDGNSQDDLYMLEMFQEVFADQEPACYVWSNNYHSWDPAAAGTGVGEAGEDPQRKEVETLISSRRCVCIMQRWGGKREVMYTAFRALGDSLVKVLESNHKYGAVGGDVMILNHKESYISFMSSLRYWVAFNIERACQSFFNCVSCISGPLGLYRNDLLQQFLESWYNQKFLGSHCTFGDDRHLTNRMLSMGYATKYTARSKCYTETPAQFLRWLNQQTRWMKSYFREWLYNARWWHKHHLWMTYESIVSGVFPFFVTITIIQLFWTGSLWDILWVLCCIQLIGLMKAFFACILRGDLVMVFMSLYSALYMTSLLPTKYFAILTINKSSWGTSGRRTIVGNYIPLLPLSVWSAILLGGLCYTAYKESQQSWQTPTKIMEMHFLLLGSVAYVCYWTVMLLLYWVCFRRVCRRRNRVYRMAV
ncbi:hypothetical protein CRUP_003651 [Coryphaenoides rupestris]|nr:hypothetical protein CRUP_003651 [Coryphaenoides rupestris]